MGPGGDLYPSDTDSTDEKAENAQAETTLGRAQPW